MIKYQQMITLFLAALLLCSCSGNQEGTESSPREGSQAVEQDKEVTFSSVEAGVQQVKNLLQQGQINQGVETLEQLIKTYPEHQEVLTKQLLNVYFKLNRLAEAEKIINKHLEANPNDDEFLFYQGQLLLARQQKKEAGEIFKRIVDINPDSLQAQQALAGMALSSGQFVEAASRYQIILDKAPNSPSVIQQLLRVQLQLGREEKAIETAGKLKNILPGEMQAHRQYQDLALDAGLRQKLLTEYRQLADRMPDSAMAHYLFGRVNEDPTAALIEFETATRLDPDFFWAQYALGIQAFSQGDYEKARRAMEKASETDSPDAVRGRLYLILIDMAEGKYDVAIEKARNMLENNPNDFRVYTLIHQMMIEQEKYEEAEKYADQLQKNPGPGKALGLLQKVEIALRQGDWEAFNERVNQSLQTRNMSETGRRELAYFVLQGMISGKGEIPEEIASALDFEKIFKEHPEPLLWLGILKWRNENPEAAVQLWKSAYQLRSRFISDAEVFTAQAAGFLAGNISLQGFNEWAEYVRYNYANDFWAVKGIHFMRNDNTDEAVDAFKKGVEVSRGAEFPARWLEKRVNSLE